MLKHEEMIENVHRRIAQYEKEKKLQNSKFKNIFSAIKQKNNEEEYTEVVNGTERIDTSRRTLRIISTIAASAVLVTGIGATSMFLHKNNSLKPTVTNEENDLNEYETSTLSAEIIAESPFEELLNSEYSLTFPTLQFSETMRNKITEMFDSIDEWKVSNNYSRFLHYDNGGAYSPLSERIILASDNYLLQICDDDIIEYCVLDGLNWKKTFYECDSLALINGIADIMESEFKDNGVDFDDDVSYYKIVDDTNAQTELTPIQQRLLKLCMNGNSWKEETMEANRDFSQFDLSLVNQNSGSLYIMADKNYINSNTGAALFIDKNGITYTCENNSFFSSNILHIMTPYDYPDMKLYISILSADGKELISANDENRAQLENFIYYDFPAMLTYNNEYTNSNDYETNMYSIEISYKSGSNELRNESYSIGSFGTTGRLDYVLDPVYGWSPAGCMNYTLDIFAFESKLDKIINNKQSEKTPNNKNDKNTSESVQPTTQKEDKPDNNDKQQQVKPTNNEKQEVETSTKAEPTEPTNPNEQNLGDPHKYYDDWLAPTPHVIIDYELPDYTYVSVASCITHDNNALDDFVANVFVPMLELKDYNWGPDRYAKNGYTIYRIYETEKNYTGIPAKYMIRDGYFIGDNDAVSLCSYIYFNGDWEPCGAENFSFDYAKFEELLKETLHSSKLPDEQKES